MDTFKFKITLDRHNAIQNLDYYDLPNPPRFSLPSTFKLVWRMTEVPDSQVTPSPRETEVFRGIDIG